MRRTSLQPWFGIWQEASRNATTAYQAATQWQEMAQSAVLTVGLRLSAIEERMRRGQEPDVVELTRMVTEKQMALIRSGAALLAWQTALVAQAWQAPTRAVGQVGVPGLQANLRLANDLVQLSLRDFGRVLRPYHRATTANARRLQRKRA